MKNTLLEYIILYLLVFCVALVVATLARLSALSLGTDSFTAFVVFIIVLIVLSIVYFSIHLVLQDLLLPLISNGLNKIPFFRNKNKITSNLLNLDEIRKDNENKVGKGLESAIYYTQKTFAPYAADEEIKRLCEYISLYANKQKFNGLKPIQITNQLTTLDISHYGWNIWNHFRIRKQEDIALLLKLTFAHTLHDAEVETIKKHLKDDEHKGIIKIRENIGEE